MAGALTLRKALDRAAAALACISPEPRRDAERLAMHLLGCDLAALIAHPERLLTPEQAGRLDTWILRRRLAEPLQYITGSQEFFGLPMKVTPDVLIPRPETELVVEALLARVDRTAPLRIADVGTGSGAIAIALAHALPRAEVTAIDFSPSAIAVARENAARHGVLRRLQWVEGDLLEGAARGSFDAVASNPPYIADCERLELQVESYEPRLALFAGPTGMEAFERLVPQARRALKPGGWLIMEMGAGQGTALAGLLTGWNEIEFLPDLRSIPRVAVARCSAPEHESGDND